MTQTCMTCQAPATQTRMNGIYPCCDPCADAKDRRTATRLALKASGMTNAEVVASLKK